MMSLLFSVAVFLFCGLLSSAASEGMLVEAERFREHGGWVVDPQFMDQMGSPYLLAHGLGRPPPDSIEDGLQNAFFAFDNGVGRDKWTPEEQALTLKELGYAGIGYTGVEHLAERLNVFDTHGLKVFSLYVHCHPRQTLTSPSIQKENQR